MSVAVILPALDEEEAVASVVEGFRKTGARVVVVDNGSADRTAERARLAGADVVHEPRRGYGSACLAGLRSLEEAPPAFVVFADCDGTLEPRDLPRLLSPLERDEADLVLGRRAVMEAGAMPRHQKTANEIICLGLRVLHRVRVRDVPPLRAMRWSWIRRVRLKEPTFGLPIETVIATHRLGGRIVEVDSRYRSRVGGRSKVGGSWTGALRAGLVIVLLLVRLRFRRLAA